MPIQPVISNNSPLVELLGINLLSLSRDLYTEVWIPRKVEEEFLRKDPIVRGETLKNAPWIKTIDLTDPQIAAVYVGLHVPHGYCFFSKPPRAAFSHSASVGKRLSTQTA